MKIRTSYRVSFTRIPVAVLPADVRYMFPMDRPRIRISGKQLADVIYVWLRHVPTWMWGKDPAYERLKADKRHDPMTEPDPKGAVAEHIAAELDRLGWEVTYPEPGKPTSPPEWRSAD